jgi:hypothetical protein
MRPHHVEFLTYLQNGTIEQIWTFLGLFLTKTPPLKLQLMAANHQKTLAKLEYKVIACSLTG